jgi:hypothetical protein
MTRACFLIPALVLLLVSCAMIRRPVQVVPWPSEVNFLEGEGEVSFISPKEHNSGSFLVSLSDPDRFFLEVYGTFGQTVIHVEKKDGKFLFIEGDKKTSDEEALSAQFGFTFQELMDDLTLRGVKVEGPEGTVIRRPHYEVIYSRDRRGRSSICWKRPDGRICLAFDKIVFEEP